ncbi:NAD(P)-binding protein [Trichodelitschia bisporula]|uniref:NAD(P)-binding protein n=1 Tax=Trichodelitschia bisporula TaxID=703511 RepID=A0A6G1HP54_9PEZI|nr:NAD(P)-binding protein [Trichodelitschia bisporula]
MANTTSSTMRAWMQSARGSIFEKAVLADIPLPGEPTGSDILVKISHAALNPVDLELARVIPTFWPFPHNRGISLDFAGRVERAGPLVPPELGPGVSVCAALGVAQVWAGKGALAEYIVVPCNLVAVTPQSLTSAVAAGLGITGQTVALMMREAKVKSGDRVLVNGASGGVGSLLVQVLKGKGAHVTGICSAANFPLVQRLGADEVVDYTSAPVAEQLAGVEQNFDYIFDTMRNQALFEGSPAYLKPSGLYLNIGSRGSSFWQMRLLDLKNDWLPVFLGGTPRKWKTLAHRPSGDFQRMVTDWVNAGLITDVPIDSEVPMAEALKGFERLETRHAKGKVIIRIQD